MPRLDTDIPMADWRADRIDNKIGRDWVLQWHYTHRDTSARNYWGAFNRNGELMAVVCVGLTANKHGIAKKYDIAEWKGNMEVKRVVAHPGAPRNTASKAISLVCRIFAADGYDWLFSYADTGQNHHGGIYQALNAVYVGESEARTGWLVDGVMTHPRTLVSRWGTQGYDNLMRIADELGIVIKKMPRGIPGKHTYILLIGTPETRRAMRRRLAPYVHPYPKRRHDHELAA